MPPNADDVRSQLDRLLASSAFASADRLSRFLRYVVERTLAGEGDRLKEYVIGLEVFDRGDQYDPRLDSIVRVEAGRLRAKVDDYYRGDGRDDDVIIRLRRGSYVPLFEQRQAPPSPLSSPDASTSKSTGKATGWRLALGIVAAGLLLLAVAAWRTGLWTPDAAPAPTITVAVLPFAHYSTHKGDQLLAARVTDGVTSELARNGALGVVSRTSALQFANAGRSLREVAQMLNADIVIEGSLVREGDRVRVEARLVHGRQDRKFWVQEFVGTVAEIPELQRRIATAAAAAAAAAATGTSRAASPRRPVSRRHPDGAFGERALPS
ncbi:MAG: hypothetical protein GEV06_20200 [Luteitalea sp.]|nr:hypothetical protein [Luteitalea sp.]